MKREMSRWGVGPRILLSAAGYAVLAGVLTGLYPDLFLLRVIPYPVFLAVGLVLLTAGIPMVVIAGRAAMMAYNRDQLATTGIFGLTRNPIYSAWIVFIIPGLVVLSRSWLLLLTPLVAYAAFKLLIRRENDYLEKRFGQAYLDYKARVNELLPIPRFWLPRRDSNGAP